MRVFIVTYALLVVVGCGGSSSDRIDSIYELKKDPNPANIEQLRGFLDSKDADVRVTAVNALVTLGVDDAPQLAVDGLSDEDDFVRATSAKLVGDLDDANLSGHLVERLRSDRSALVRKRAAQALERIGGDDAGPALVRALEDPDEDVRLAAIRGVRSLAPGEGVDRLVEILRDDPTWEVRVQAASALGKSWRPEAREALETAREDDVEFVRIAAEKALGEMPPPPPEPEEPATPIVDETSGE